MFLSRSIQRVSHRLNAVYCIRIILYNRISWFAIFSRPITVIFFVVVKTNDMFYLKCIDCGQFPSSPHSRKFKWNKRCVRIIIRYAFGRLKLSFREYIFVRTSSIVDYTAAAVNRNKTRMFSRSSSNKILSYRR